MERVKKKQLQILKSKQDENIRQNLFLI
jgi:hypothetical protein